MTARLSPYAKAQRAATRRSGVKAPPRPKFKIGNRVRVSDTSITGTIVHIGQYDDHLGQYRYKVRDDDPRGSTKNWNSDSLVKIPKRKKVANPARRLSKAAGARLCACNGGRVANPSRRRNPDVMRIPLPPSQWPNYSSLGSAGYMRASEQWTDEVLALPVRFKGQPAWVKDVWDGMTQGFGKVRGDVVTMSQTYDGYLWRDHPELKGRKTASIRLLENGDVVAMRGPAPTKRGPKAVGRKAKAGKKTSVRTRVSSTKRVANPRSKRATARRKMTR